MSAAAVGAVGGPLDGGSHDESENSEGVDVDGGGELSPLARVDEGVLGGEVPMVDLISGW